MPVFHRHGFDNSTKGNRVVASYRRAFVLLVNARFVKMTYWYICQWCLLL